MRRRGKTGRKAIKAQRHRALTRRNAPKVARRRNSSVASQETEVERLTRELEEAREQQTATSEVLNIIRRSPADAQPVFDTIVQSAARLCGAIFSVVYLCDDDHIRIAAVNNFTPEATLQIHELQELKRPHRSHLGGRAILERAIVHVPDVLADAEYSRELALAGGWRAVLAVPLLRDGIPVGAITVAKTEPVPFSDRQILLLKTFADQALIAIENVRLFETEQQQRRELAEALEQQTATSEVLKVISSSPGELEPVFKAMLENATKLCGASYGTMWLKEGEGFRAAARHGTLPVVSTEGGWTGIYFQPRSDIPLARCARTRTAVHVTDMREEQSYLNGDPWIVSGVDEAGVRSLLAVPMLKDNELVGAIGIYRTEVRSFSDKQIELVTNFAAQAVIAIENTRLVSELRARTGELTQSVGDLRALGEISQVVNSTLDLQTVLDTIVANAARISGTEAGAIYVLDQSQTEFQLKATIGMSKELIAAVRNMNAEISETIAHCGSFLQVPDLRELPSTPMNDTILRAGYRARLLVPLLRSGKVVGALAVRRKAPGEFSSSTVDLLKTFAAQSVLAIQNARLFADIEDKGRQLETANKYKSHFLASASHDLRQPLHALNLFVGQLRDESNPAERSRLVSRIDEAVGSMNELFEALLDMAKLEAGILKPNPTAFPVEHLLDRIETTFADAARKKGLRLRVVASEAWVSSDPILLERIMLNLVSNAVHYTERGGVVVGCRHRGQELRIDICDTGAGIPADERQRIFGEFYQLSRRAPDRSGGFGLGLAIVDRLGRLLGHRVELESSPGRGLRFSVSVPLAAQSHGAEMPGPLRAIADPASGKRVIVIDDDTLVLDGMRGILQSWGCRVQTAVSGDAALAGLVKDGGSPDLIISDSRLADGESGVETIERLRAAVGAPIPAFVITGDTAPESLREARAGGFLLLHKPVSPMALRTTLNRLLKAHDTRVASLNSSVA